MNSIYDELRQGTKVYSRKIKGDRQTVGVTTGAFHPCRLACCGGVRVTVKWSDGCITHPCSKGLRRRKGRGFEIG